jgi:hypothetical protein
MSKYGAYQYKYADYNDSGVEGMNDMMGSLIFYTKDNLIYDRTIKTESDIKKIAITEKQKKEIFKNITYKERIIVPKGTKGVFYDDIDITQDTTSNGTTEFHKATIWIDFGDSIIIPFSSFYNKYFSPPEFIHTIAWDHNDYNRFNLSMMRNCEFTCDDKITVPYICDSDNCIEYELKTGSLINIDHYLYCRNWKKYKSKTKRIDEEKIKIKKASGKTKHNF